MKLLIIEDDPLLRSGLEKALIREEYRVDAVANIQSAEQMLALDANYSAILLDIGLPDGNGLNLLQSIRKSETSMPVIIITARDALEDRIIGLDSGADDYLVKPFEIAELYARLRAVIRRHHGQADNQVNVDEFVMNLSNRTIRFNGEPLELTLREYAIFSRLILKYNEIVSRDTLLQDMYAWQDSFGSNTLEVYIHRLRQKIGKDRILTARGLGYRLVPA